MNDLTNEDTVGAILALHILKVSSATCYKVLTEDNAMEQNKGSTKGPLMNESLLSSDNTTLNVGHSHIIVDNSSNRDQGKQPQINNSTDACYYVPFMDNRPSGTYGNEH
jgi:hypothetical protein